MASAQKTFTVSQIAGSLKINPKVVRAKLRRHNVKHNGKWEFTAKQRADVVKLIKTDHRFD